MNTMNKNVPFVWRENYRDDKNVPPVWRVNYRNDAASPDKTIEIAHEKARQFLRRAAWRDRAAQESGKALQSGHWLAEEVPDETSEEVKRYLAA